MLGTALDNDGHIAVNKINKYGEQGPTLLKAYLLAEEKHIKQLITYLNNIPIVIIYT